MVLSTLTRRLRRSGLVSALAVAAAVSTAPITANAAIVYSGPLNFSVDGSGAQQNTTVTIGGQNAFDLFGVTTNGNGTPNTNLGLANFAAVHAVTDTPVTAGSTVDATTVFSPNTAVPVNSGSQQEIASGTSAYYGFVLSLTGSDTEYGYLNFSVDVTGTQFTLNDYAYEDSGAGIVVGSGEAVPEPLSASLFATGLALTALLRRKGRTVPHG